MERQRHTYTLPPAKPLKLRDLQKLVPEDKDRRWKLVVRAFKWLAFYVRELDKSDWTEKEKENTRTAARKRQKSVARRVTLRLLASYTRQMFKQSHELTDPGMSVESTILGFCVIPQVQAKARADLLDLLQRDFAAGKQETERWFLYMLLKWAKLSPPDINWGEVRLRRINRLLELAQGDLEGRPNPERAHEHLAAARAALRLYPPTDID